MEPGLWSLFALTSLIATVAPGPNTLLVMAHAVRFGFRASLLTIGANQTNGIAANMSSEIGGDQALIVGGQQSTEIGAAQSLNVGASQTMVIGADQAEDIGASQTLVVGSGQTITINARPTASFSSNSPTGVGYPVDFGNTGTTGVTYSWDFGTGASPATSTSENPTGVTYTASGTKTVTLISTSAGCSRPRAAATKSSARPRRGSARSSR